MYKYTLRLMNLTENDIWVVYRRGRGSKQMEAKHFEGGKKNAIPPLFFFNRRLNTRI